MAQCNEVSLNFFEIDRLSNTESERNFIKFLARELPEPLRETPFGSNLNGKNSEGDSYSVRWGTGNRMYFPKKMIMLKHDKSYRMEFHDGDNFEISEF